MKRFILRFILFCVPLAVLAVPFAVVYVESGQGLTMAEVVRRQEGDPDALYLPESYLATELLYKQTAIAAVNPEIIVAGKSRTLEIRSDFFRDPGAFYNFGGFDTGGVSLDTDDIYQYVESLPADGRLKVMLFDLSSYLKAPPEESSADAAANAAYVSPPPSPPTAYDPATFFLEEGWHDIYQDYLNGRFSFRPLLKAAQTSPNIGIQAILNQEGFRADGSYSVGTPERLQSLIGEVPAGVAAYVSQIDAGQDVAVDYGPSISQEQLAAVAKLLALCQSKGIYVIGYLSPYAQEIYQALESENDAYGTAYRAMPAALQSLFGQYGYDFYDMRDLSAIGSSDKELYDPEHPTAKSMMRLVVALAEKEPKLQEYVDVAALKAKIAVEPF